MLDECAHSDARTPSEESQENQCAYLDARTNPRGHIMDKAEFANWIQDLKRKLPETGGYVERLPVDVKQAWFEEVFSRFDLRDAKAWTYQIFSGERELEAFKRERIPALFARGVQEIAYRRRQREQAPDRSHVGAMENVKSDAIMGRAYREVTARMSEYSSKNEGQRTPEHLVKQWTREAFESSPA
tara:strand:+ start:378 stop:935 length:558 start_codon:yes stop_codon:yes gene_type:complete